MRNIPVLLEKTVASYKKGEEMPRFFLKRAIFASTLIIFNNMKKLLIVLASMLVLSGCGTVPLTGRRQILLVSDQDVLSSSLTQYRDYMKTAPKSASTQWSNMVTRVGKKIADATERYLRANGLAAEVKDFSWEFNLVKDDQVNAFCMPGGKIVVYE